MNDNLSNRNFLPRKTANETRKSELGAIESRLENIRSAFDQYEDFTNTQRVQVFQAEIEFEFKFISRPHKKFFFFSVIKIWRASTSKN